MWLVGHYRCPFVVEHRIVEELHPQMSVLRLVEALREDISSVLARRTPVDAELSLQDQKRTMLKSWIRPLLDHHKRIERVRARPLLFSLAALNFGT